MTTAKNCTNLAIGEMTWLRGNEIEVTTEPYELYGKMWQDGIGELGKITFLTEEQKKADLEKTQAEWKEQQSGFARLKVPQKT